MGCGRRTETRGRRLNLIEAGRNYGWNVMEGNSCYKARADSCNQNGLEAQVAEYGAQQRLLDHWWVRV